MNIPADDPRAGAVVDLIRSGDVERLRRLLQENPGLATARIVDAVGTSRTLLHVVADWPGHFPNGAATVAALVAAGANVNACVIHAVPGRFPETPLQVAQESGAEDLVQWLRGRGARLPEELP